MPHASLALKLRIAIPHEDILLALSSCPIFLTPPFLLSFSVLFLLYSHQGSTHPFEPTGLAGGGDLKGVS